MNETRPLIFLTNDDGVNAKGLNELLKMLQPLGEVVVMAPDSGRSGAACSITPGRPVKYTKLREEPGLAVYQCTGTPVDCVKLALEQVVSRMPDLLVSGINHGDNASVSVLYSGTMGAVFEGCMKGIPSVGFSLCDVDADADFSACTPYVQRIVRRVLTAGLPERVCLNVNFPAGPRLQGIKVARMAKGTWGSEWVSAVHPKQEPYFWLTGRFTNLEPEAGDTDFWALEHGFVSVVPVQMDVTAAWALSQFKDLEEA